MSKLPKFLVCENPILTGDHDGRLFILHSRTPVILAEVLTYEDATEEFIMDIQRQMPMGGKLEYGTETILFAPVWMPAIPTSSADDAQRIADKLAAIMRRMADWYEAYLNWEDE